MRDNNGSASHSSFEIETTDNSIQTLSVPNTLQRFEGLAFSLEGDILGAATSDTDTVFLFQRKPDGRFEDTPYCTLRGPEAGLNYPHDLSFCRAGGAEFLAVAERTGSVSIFEKNAVTGDFSAKPVFRITGPEAQLNFSDAVSFVPPDRSQLAVSNLSNHRVSFYSKASGSSHVFKLKPSYELQGGSICEPDGLAFSERGTWLAVANHGNHTVSVFRRWRGLRTLGRWHYGPEPVSVIRDPELRYPHSLAFTPKENHLVVTDAGANYFSVYQTERDDSGELTWSQTPVLRHKVGSERRSRK